MLPVSDELKEKLKHLNVALKMNFPLEHLDRRSIRKRLEGLGSFYRVDKWESTALKQWLGGKSIVGIDGSVNSTKGTPARALSVFQALALGTQGEEKWAADMYTPLLEDHYDGEHTRSAKDRNKRSSLLADLEINLATEILHEWNAHAILMDGSLLHFYMDSPERWHGLAQCALDEGVYLIGVSEEIATRGLANALFPENPTWADHDLLYGVLDIGEVFEWEEWSPAASNLWRTAFRSSMSPQPIVVDGLLPHRKERKHLLQLVYSLTPEQGRGIPLWLDIIDSQVRVTDSLIQTMIEQYIDPGLRQRLFGLKRHDRII